MPKKTQQSMLKRTWSKLEALVESATKPKYREIVTTNLSALEKAFAEWLFVSQLERMIPNTVRVPMGGSEKIEKDKSVTKRPTVLVSMPVDKAIDRINSLLPNAGSKMQEYHDKLDALKAMPKEKRVIEPMKAAAKRVDKVWMNTKKAFIKSLRKAATPVEVAEARTILKNLTKGLIGDDSDEDALKRVPWEGEETLTSWPVERARLLEDETRVVDLIHNALREVASSNYHPRVVSTVAEKYGLPHADIQWLSSILAGGKTAPSKVTKDEEVEIPVHPSEQGDDVDHDRKAKVVWDSILSRSPRAIHHYLKDFEVRYEMGSIFPPLEEEGSRRKIDRIYLGKEHRKHFFKQGKDEPAVDMRTGIIYLPPTAALWSVEDMTKKLVSKAVDIFLQRSRLLTKGDLEKHISKFFLTEKDIDKLISALNDLSLEAEPAEDIRGLEDQLKKHYQEPEKSQRFHEWWAENQGHFTHLLKDKRMVPLFQKWLTEILMSMVTTTPSPKDVPYPVTEFVMKMSSLDRFKHVVTKRIWDTRMALMQEPGTEEVLKDLKEAAENVV